MKQKNDTVFEISDEVYLRETFQKIDALVVETIRTIDGVDYVFDDKTDEWFFSKVLPNLTKARKNPKLSGISELSEDNMHKRIAKIYSDEMPASYKYEDLLSKLKKWAAGWERASIDRVRILTQWLRNLDKKPPEYKSLFSEKSAPDSIVFVPDDLRGTGEVPKMHEPGSGEILSTLMFGGVGNGVGAVVDVTLGSGQGWHVKGSAAGTSSAFWSPQGSDRYWSAVKKELRSAGMKSQQITAIMQAFKPPGKSLGLSSLKNKNLETFLGRKEFGWSDNPHEYALAFRNAFSSQENVGDGAAGVLFYIEKNSSGGGTNGAFHFVSPSSMRMETMWSGGQVKIKGPRSAVDFTTWLEAAWRTISENEPPATLPEGHALALRLLIHEAILAEDLTKSDKKEIERISRKQAQKEIDKVVGKNFSKSVQEEIKKVLKNKATKQEIADITKAVIKKLYRELAVTQQPIIDRIKL